MGKAVLIISLILLMVGCASNNADSPDIQGFVVKNDESGLLIITNIDEKDFKAAIQYEKDLIKNHTLYLISADQNMKKDLKKGDKVAVWFRGGVDQSNPAKASAKKLIKIV